MTLNKAKILKKLKNDEDYYGDFGNQFLSNSHVSRLLKDPLNIFKESKPSPAFLIGGYFHTCILEPEKLKKYKVVKSSTRNTKAYKYVAGGDVNAIKTKYKLTAKQEKELNGQKADTKEA